MEESVLKGLFDNEQLVCVVVDKKGVVEKQSKGFSSLFGNVTSGTNISTVFPDLATRSRSKINVGSHNIETKLWKGKAFVQELDDKKHLMCVFETSHVVKLNPEVKDTQAYFEFADSLSEATFVTDFFGSVLFCNRVAESLFGYSPLDVVDKNIGFFLSGSSEIVTSIRFRKNVELDGRTRDLGSVSIKVTFWPQESCVFVICHRKGTRRTADEGGSSSFFRELFYRTLSPCLFFGNDLKILRANRACEKMLCYDTVSLIGRHINDFFPGVSQKVTWSKGSEKKDRTQLISNFEAKKTDNVRFRAKLALTFLAEGECLMEIHDITEYSMFDSKDDLKERKLNSVLDTVADGILTITPDGTVQSFNSAAETIFGYSAEEVIGRNVKMLMPSPYMDNHDRYLTSYLQSHKPKILGTGRDVEGLRKDGTTFPMHLSVSEILTEYCHLFTGIIRDTSETRRIHDEHIMEAKKLNAILNCSVDGIILIDSAGLIKSMNPASEKMFGYPLSSVKNKNISCLMPEPYRSRHDRYMNSYLNTGLKRIIGIGREVSGQRADGSTFPMYLSVSEVKVGGVHLFTGMCRDITKQKVAEAAVMKEKNKLQSILDQSVDGIFTVTTSGIVKSFNKAAENMFGFTLSEILDNPMEWLCMKVNNGEIVVQFDSGMTAGGEGEWTGKHKDGTEFPVDLSISEVKTADTHIYSVIVRDLRNLRVNLMLRTF
eukprot:Nk52_evm5s2209 gene=Nk52_evmTU5s2209